MESRVPMVRLEPEPSSYAYDSAPSSISEPKRVGLVDLPDEILLEIIRRVPLYQPDSRRLRISSVHLVNLAMCSRRLHRLTEPLLYNQVNEPTVGTSHKHAQYLLSIFRRISARPYLARCVKLFEGSATDQLLPVGSELTDEDRMRLRTAVHEASTTEDEAGRWIQAAESGQWAAIVSLLLSMTPNLEVLWFEDWSYNNDDYTYLLAFLDRAKKLQDSGEESPFAMSNLRSVYVSYGDTEGGLRVDQLMPFLELRSVETFGANMVHAEPSGGEDLEDSISPILKDRQLTLAAKDLSFFLGKISHYHMVVLLRCFPQLERFYYWFGGSTVSDNEDSDFEPPRLLAALEHLKPCLKELTLLVDSYEDFSHLKGYPIGSLADFQKLISITANASIMIGMDWDGEEDAHDENGFAATQNLVHVVPTTLEFLCLRQCQQHVVRHVFELVSQKTWRTPALRKIDLGWEGITYPDKERPQEAILHPGFSIEAILHPGFSKDEVKKLMVECKAAGIEIIINGARL